MAYTTIDDPTAHFQIASYTGNTTAPRNITNDGNSDLKPDLIWTKNLSSNGTNHVITNSSLGFDIPNSPSGGGQQSTNSDGTENTPAGTYGYISAHLTDGFTTAAGGTNDDTHNENGSNFVAYQWKANGGTTSTNSDGDINSTVQVNSDAGFSIITDSPPNNTARTIGHGLGAKPDFIIRRARNRGEQWNVMHHAFESTLPGGWWGLDTQAAYNDSTTSGYTSLSSTTFGVGTDYSVNGNYNYVTYAWKEVQGYSKFGYYRGNSADDGTFVYLGFKPRWVLIKSKEANMDWNVMDSAQSPINPMTKYLTANTADPQGSSSTKTIDFLSTGFKCRDDNNLNFSDHYFYYAAFAESPFVSSEGVPTTAK